MKKLTIIALALCLAVVMAAPVMAVDADFSGEYRVRGFYTEHYDLDKDTASNAFMDMRFQLQTVFKVSDILSVTARFDALEDHVWGKVDDRVAGNANNVNFDRAYMTIKAPVGKFVIGRAGTGYWGTTFVDSESDGTDCIKFIKKIDNLTLYAIFMKLQELDDSTNVADRDEDRYDLRFKYKMENTTFGLLTAFINDKTTNDATTHTYVAMPFFVSKFGPLAIQGELAYKWGETDYDDTTADKDIKKLAYNLEATYNVGPASIMAGYAFISGDDGTDANENSAYGSVGADWEKLFILTYDETPVNVLGPNAANLTATGDYGAKIIYGGANFSPLDNLELGLVVGYAEADELGAGETKDEYGVEYDVTLNWQIYDNLSYTAIAAFLDAGDFYKEQAGNPTTFEDTYALFHQLQLTF